MQPIAPWCRRCRPSELSPRSRNADNPYLKIQVNEELLKEIWKDVERTYPECEFLSSNESRKVLQRMLFHWPCA